MSGYVGAVPIGVTAIVLKDRVARNPGSL